MCATLAGRHDQPQEQREHHHREQPGVEGVRAAARRRRWSRSAPAPTRAGGRCTRWVASHGCGSTRRRSFAGRRWRLAATRRCTARCRKVRPPRRSSAAPSRRPPATSCAQLICATSSRRSRRRSPTPAGGPPSRRWCSPSACSCTCRPRRQRPSSPSSRRPGGGAPRADWPGRWWRTMVDNRHDAGGGGVAEAATAVDLWRAPSRRAATRAREADGPRVLRGRRRGGRAPAGREARRAAAEEWRRRRSRTTRCGGGGGRTRRRRRELGGGLERARAGRAPFIRRRPRMPRFPHLAGARPW